MNPDKQSIARIREIFTEAQQLPEGAARDAFIAEACGDDPDLRQEVVALLNAFDTTCDFLSRDASGATFIENPDMVGTQVDGYRLVDLIGEGGFGEVYRAEQSGPLKREVALKIIKLGMDTKHVLARFDIERKALARMNHPNIAQVYDAGTTESGRPYFVMELVHGVPILEYCDQHRFPLSDRIALFQQVCEGIQHAHKKGILHRDLKPSNILVAEDDGKPIAKIIDFGVAKSLEGRLTEKALATLEEMLIGTPMYMSPEQLERKNDEVDTRSDIYSLGIILYELVAGATPLAHHTPTSLTIAEMREALHARDLPRPSKRFQNLGRKTTVIAGRRGLRPPMLKRLLNGDLDWIVMKAIELEPEHRYEDGLALSDDLTRFVGSRPVSAHRPGFTRRTRKFFRRHKTTRYVTCSVTLTVLIGIGIMTYSYIQITKEPLSLVEQRGWKLKKFCDMGELGANGFAMRPDGSVLLVGEWGSMPKGLYQAREGGTCSAADAFSTGEIYTDPECAIELPDGVYVGVNGPRGLRGKILRIPTSGGNPGIVCDDPLIRNPFFILVAPEGFDGPNVNPGDLLVFDLHFGIRAIDRTTGTARPLISRGDNILDIQFGNGCFSPDGDLYVSFLKQNTEHVGARIVRISAEGGAELVLDNFRFPHVNNSQGVGIAVHPITGELFFSVYGEMFGFHPGKTMPRHVLSKVIADMRWAPDGNKLYLIADRAVWTLTGPGIAKSVSVGRREPSGRWSIEREEATEQPTPVQQMRDAAIAGDIAKAKELAKAHPEVINSTRGNNSNTTPLHLAAWYGRTEFAAWLLEQNAAPDAINRFGNTPLHLAAGQGRKEIVLMLLDKKPPLNVRNEENCTPLDYALAFDEIADLLRLQGAEAIATAEPVEKQDPVRAEPTIKPNVNENPEPDKSLSVAAKEIPKVGTPRYVDKNCRDPKWPHASRDTAARNIQDAVNAASSDDTVLIADGIYHIDSPILVSKGIAVRGENGREHVVVDADGHCRVFSLSPPESETISLAGLSIVDGNAKNDITGGGGIFAFGIGSILITDCLIEKNRSDGPSGGINIKAKPGGSITANVQHCVIRNNRSDKNSGGIGMNIRGSCQITIEDCVIEGNEAANGGGIWCTAPNGAISISRCRLRNNEAEKLGGGIRLMRNCTLSDSLITGNKAGEAGGGIYGGIESGSRIENCTLVNNKSHDGAGASKSILINSIIVNTGRGRSGDLLEECNVSFSCSPELTAGTDGNITVPPRFVAPISGNYRLQGNSPCVDEGSVVARSLDLDRNPRTVDGNGDGKAVVDMGAFEFQSLETKQSSVSPESLAHPSPGKRIYK